MAPAGVPIADESKGANKEQSRKSLSARSSSSVNSDDYCTPKTHFSEGSGDGSKRSPPSTSGVAALGPGRRKRVVSSTDLADESNSSKRIVLDQERHVSSLGHRRPEDEAEDMGIQNPGSGGNGPSSGETLFYTPYTTMPNSSSLGGAEVATEEEGQTQGRQLANGLPLRRDPVIRRLFVDGASHTQNHTRTPSPPEEEGDTQEQQLAYWPPSQRDPVVRRLFSDGTSHTGTHSRTPSPPFEEDESQGHQLVDWPPLQRDPVVRRLFGEGTSYTQTRTRTPSPPDEEDESQGPLLQQDPVMRRLFVEGTSHIQTHTRTPPPPDKEMILQDVAVDHLTDEDSFNLPTPAHDFRSPVMGENLPQFLAHEMAVMSQEGDVTVFPQAPLAPLDLDMADFELDAEAMAGFNQMYGHMFNAEGDLLTKDSGHGSRAQFHGAALYAVSDAGSGHSFHWSPTPIRGDGGGSAPERTGSSPTGSELGRYLADLSNESILPGRLSVELPADEQHLNIDENLMGILFDVTDAPLPWLTEFAQMTEAFRPSDMS